MHRASAVFRTRLGFTSIAILALYVLYSPTPGLVPLYTQQCRTNASWFSDTNFTSDNTKRSSMIRSRSSRRLRPSSPSSLEPARALEDDDLLHEILLRLPPEDDDLLHEILLRLPPQPGYLMRASLVCNRWRCLATDPNFLRRLRIHHRRPPLLGVFFSDYDGIKFTSTLDPPCRIPPERFSLVLNDRWNWTLLDCRHGRVLLINRLMCQVIVWEPITDDHRRVAFPPEFYIIHTGAVLCAADDQGHIHGDCHSSPFKVVLLATYEGGDQAVTSVYSSKTGLWGDLMSTVLPLRYRRVYISNPSTLVGNTIYWLNSNCWLESRVILAFDLGTQRLTAIEKPSSIKHGDSGQILQAEDGGLGFAAFWCAGYYERCLEIWERNVDCYGVAAWVLRKSIKLQKILGNYMEKPLIMNYVEDSHAIFVRMQSSIFMVQLESMQSKEILKTRYLGTYHPFTSFYTEGIFIRKKYLERSMKQK